MAKVHLSGSSIQKLLASNVMLYVFVFFILLSETGAMIFLKQYSLSGNPISFALGFGFYTLVSIFLVQSLRYEEMGIVNILWSAFSVIVVVATGVLIFGERVGVMELLGIIMIIAGVVVLRWSETKKKSHGGQCLHISSSDIPPRS